MKRLLNKRGFTLIELMVVMAIIAVLATLIIGAITVARNTSKETINRSNAKTFQVALESYFATNKAYPGATALPPSASYVLASSINTLNTAAAIGTPVTLNVTSGCANGGAWISSSSTSAVTISILKASCDAGSGETISLP